MDLVPGHRPATSEMRREWAAVGARTRLAAARRRRRVSQEDLARAIGISTATLRRIESGENDDAVSVGVLLAAAYALEVPFLSLIEDEWIEAAKGTPTPPRETTPTRHKPVALPP